MTDLNPPVPPNKPICAVQAFLNEVDRARNELAHASSMADVLKADRPAHVTVNRPGWGLVEDLPVPAELLLPAVEAVQAQRAQRLARLEKTHRQLVELLEERQKC